MLIRLMEAQPLHQEFVQLEVFVTAGIDSIVLMEPLAMLQVLGLR